MTVIGRDRARRQTISAVLVIVVIISAFAGYIALVGWYEKTAYPLPYQMIVTRAAKEYDVPPEIIYGVMRTESSLNPHALSPKGAAGLMQITEDTFAWLLTKTGEELQWEQIYNEEINIRYGVFFLHLLYEEFDRWETVFAAYNAGRTRVNAWLDDPAIAENGRLVNIPFPETAEYVLRVQRAAENYRRLYFTQEE